MSTAPASPFEITVAIAAVGPDITHAPLPESVPGIRYVVFIQRPPDMLPDPARSDLTYVALGSTGLSHSRNSALAHCETLLLVFADDDMTFETSGLGALATLLQDAPDLGFVAGWRAGRMPATGPRADRYRLYKRNAGRICAPELIVRVAAVRAAGVTFDPRFGVGATHPVGEDFIFVCDMLDAGLRGEGVGIVTGAHPHLSTGDNWHDPAVLTARRAVLGRAFGASAPAVRLAYALRHRARLGGWAGAWQFWSGR